MPCYGGYYHDPCRPRCRPYRCDWDPCYSSDDDWEYETKKEREATRKREAAAAKEREAAAAKEREAAKKKTGVSQVVTRITCTGGPGDWLKDQIRVQIEEKPFSEDGAMRDAHMMQIEGQKGKFVAKFWKNKCAHYAKDERSCLNEVFVSHGSSEWATKFNEELNNYCPGTKNRVEFAEAFVMKFEDGSYGFGESYLEGEYIKHNSNNGFVNPRDGMLGGDKTTTDWDTPQAFSHFTLEVSAKENPACPIIVVDIQGVGNTFTDPQIHDALHPRAFGKGNLGKNGMVQFLASHHCNGVCKSLGLQPMKVDKAIRKMAASKSSMTTVSGK